MKTATLRAFIVGGSRDTGHEVIIGGAVAYRANARDNTGETTKARAETYARGLEANGYTVHRTRAAHCY